MGGGAEQSSRRPNSKTTMTTTTKNLTPQQQRAVDSNAPRILGIAGPGAGKTHTLVQRIIRLIRDGVPPREIVVITFTNAGAKELVARLLQSAIVGLGYIGTLHGFALRCLQRYGGALGYQDRIAVLDEEQSAEMLADAMTTVGAKSTAKGLEEARQRFDPTQEARSPVTQALALCYRRMREASAVDFDTILRDFLALLNQPITRHQIPAIDHLLVDEVQDSAPIDFRIYGALPASNLFFVGDPDQAIYGFRGGDVSTMIRLSGLAEWEVIKLEQNYRCSAAICKAANKLIQRNTNRVPKLTHSWLSGPSPKRQDYAFANDEVTDVLSFVRTAIAQGLPANEIAILARSNSIVRPFVETAQALGIPVRTRKRKEMPAQDWALARAGVEILNAPKSKLAGYNWIKAKHGREMAEVERRSLARQMRSDYAQTIPGLSTSATVITLPENLARLGVSMQAIERVKEIADEIPEATLTAISFAIASQADHEAEEGQGVTITTMHAAKGREWEAVWLVGVEQEIIPGTAKSRNHEEERRVLFVGITRAKTILTITNAKMRRQSFGRKEFVPTAASQFIAEAGL